MIRKLLAKDNEKVMEYLKEEQSMNLFIIGDIENFGYDKDFMDIWGDFDISGGLRAVLLRYYNSFIPYSKGDFDIRGFIDIIKEFKDFEMFSGKSHVTEKFEDIPSLNIGKRRPTYLCELREEKNLQVLSEEFRVKKAGVQDIDRLLVLRAIITEFGHIGSREKESMQRTLETKSGRTVYIEEDGMIVSAASTTAENSVSAMIVGVNTHPDYRKRGYASLCMNVLCRELLSQGKTLCLFYDNPDAGRIYKRLGFKDIGIWNMYKR